MHAVNPPLWHPGEQAQKLQTDKPTNYYTRCGRSMGLGNNKVYSTCTIID